MRSKLASGVAGIVQDLINEGDGPNPPTHEQLVHEHVEDVIEELGDWGSFADYTNKITHYIAGEIVKMDEDLLETVIGNAAHNSDKKEVQEHVSRILKRLDWNEI